MPIARTLATTLVGVGAHVVEVEADLSQGLPGLHITGLPDAALGEARDRVRAAVLNSRRAWPQTRITVNLSPADQRKSGASFDLAVAVAVMGAARVVDPSALRDIVFVGELALDGRVRAVRGVLPAVLAAARAGCRHAVVPLANVAEALLVPEVRVWGVDRLGDLLVRLGAPAEHEAHGSAAAVVEAGHGDPRFSRPPWRPAYADLADVIGQGEARRAAEIAAAGGHNLFLHGAPGTGKTMIAERLPGLLPDLTEEESLEVTAVHSVAGRLPAGCPLVVRPPFCNPHHTATVAALVGGGTTLARPGAVSLAHRGVLFLDEAPEFGGSVLDALRQPLESGEVSISRAGGTATFPARFQLVMAANPCPCARSSADAMSCTCTPAARRRYLGKLSGPLLDRVDLQVGVDPLTAADIAADHRFVEATETVAVRVAAARAAARERFAGTRYRTNAEVPGPDLRERWPPTRAGLRLAERALAQQLVTVRGFHRLLRVSWTIADLTTGAAPGADEVAEAIGLRLPAEVTAA